VIAKNWVFWGLHRGSSDPALWFEGSWKQVNKSILQESFIYSLKLRLMEFKELSVLRPWLRLFKPWSVIFLHLLSNQQIHLTKVTDHGKLRLMDCKELSVLRLSPRLFRPWSVIRSLLFASQQIHLTKVTYHGKVRSMDCKEVSLLRPSPRFFRPWSVVWLKLLPSQQAIF